VTDLTTSEIRRAMFGRADRTHVYLVQSWSIRDGRPQVWRTRMAFTLAGVNRVLRSKWLTDDIRGEVWTTTLRVEEVNSQPKPNHPTTRKDTP
jgi:hypothetical protein